MDASMTSLSVLRSALAKHGLSPNPKLGQNFLVDANILRKIVDEVSPNPGELILEVGPGAGALTQAMARRGAWVLALEYDRGLCRLLDELFYSCQRVSIIQADATKEDLAAIARHHAAQMGLYKVKFVSNLPYYLSSDLLYQIIHNILAWESITVMLQREVAERVVAFPGTKNYGGLSVAAQAVAEARLAFSVPPGAFWPRPEVYSSLVIMHPLARPLYGQCASDFYSLVNAAFRQRRKTLASALKSLEMDRQGTAELLAHAGIDSARRGETLSASEFALLAAAYRSLKHRP